MIPDLWTALVGLVVVVVGYLGLRAKWKADGRADQERRAKDADGKRAEEARRDLDDVLRRGDGGLRDDDPRGYRD